MAASRQWKTVAVYSQIIATYVSGMIPIGLAPLPNTSCTTSLKDGFGIITKIFTSIENRSLLRAFKKSDTTKEKSLTQE